jgi:hypothetical protein
MLSSASSMSFPLSSVSRTKLHYTRAIKPGDIVYLFGKADWMYQVVSEAKVSDAIFLDALNNSSYSGEELKRIELNREKNGRQTLPHFNCARITKDGQITKKETIFPKLSLSLKAFY